MEPQRTFYYICMEPIWSYVLSDKKRICNIKQPNWVEYLLLKKKFVKKYLGFLGNLEKTFCVQFAWVRTICLHANFACLILTRRYLFHNWLSFFFSLFRYKINLLIKHFESFFGSHAAAFTSTIYWVSYLSPLTLWLMRFLY